MLLLDFDELQDTPEKVQWRIRQFLGKDVPGELPRLRGKTKTTRVPRLASQVLEPIFEVKNQELYQFLDLYPGPWMEARPFPRFEVLLEKENAEKILLLPNILLIGAQKAGTTSVCHFFSFFDSLIYY